MTTDQPQPTKPFTDKDESWFVPPIVIPLFLVIAVVVRAIFITHL